MFFQSAQDLVPVLGIAAFILLALAIIGGVIASLKSFQVRQFQDLLFKAERKIDTLERRMFDVLNAVPVALVETDATGKFTFANKAAHQLLGRKDSELIGLRFHSATWGIAYPDGRVIPGDLMPIARTLRGQTVRGFQHLLTNHGSQEKVMVSVTSMPITNRVGEVIGSTSALVEIETTSGEGIDDLTGLWRGHWFAAATVPFWGLDNQGQIIDINNAALDAFDIKREQAIGQNWTQFFVDDTDFQAAIDYLGDTQDDTSTHPNTSMRLMLNGPGGALAPFTVTAWVVRTHEDGERGLTVMAFPAPAIDTATEMAPLTLPIAPAIDDDEAQELADHRFAEKARASMGVGTWQYDPEADTIVEDEGMMALIGREEVGGPTLISDDDQAIADAAFGELMSGATDQLAFDIKVTHKDGRERWISLEGQARTGADGVRHVYGVALDRTAWKQAETVATVVTQVDEAAMSEAVEKAREEAREAALAEARAEHAEALATLQTSEKAVSSETQAVDLDALRAEAREEAEAAAQASLAAQVASQVEAELASQIASHDATHAAALAEAEARHQAELAAEVARLEAEHETALQTVNGGPVTTAEPVIIREVDPAAAAENETLKTQLEGLRQQLSESEERRNELQVQMDGIFFARPVAVEEGASTSTNDTRVAELQTQLAQAQDRHDDLAQRYHVLANTPDPVPDTHVQDDQIATLRSELNELKDMHAALGRRYQALVDTPAPLPDYSERDAQVAALNARLNEAEAAHASLADKHQTLSGRHEALSEEHETLRNTSVSEPDYSAWEARLASAQFEIAKWQAAYDDAQARMAQIPKVDPTTETKLTQLEEALVLAQQQQAETQGRLDQLNAQLSHAQRFETVGRLTSDVAQDFAQMLSVINGALEIMTKQNESPENIRRLSEAALAAGKRGERLTRQLQAFQTEDL